MVWITWPSWPAIYYCRYLNPINGSFNFWINWSHFWLWMEHFYNGICNWIYIWITLPECFEHLMKISSTLCECVSLCSGSAPWEDWQLRCGRENAGHWRLCHCWPTQTITVWGQYTAHFGVSNFLICHFFKEEISLFFSNDASYWSKVSVKCQDIYYVTKYFCLK